MLFLLTHTLLNHLTCVRNFSFDLMLSEAKVCGCAHNFVDLIILEAKVGVCVQKPVYLMLLEAKVCGCAQDHVDLIILEERVGVCVQKPVDLI